MAEKIVFPLSAGYSDISQYPDWQNGEARVIENYEMTINGQLNKRSVPETFDSGLNDLISGEDWNVISFKVCYFTFLPKDINPLRPYVMLFCLIDTLGYYRLHLVYQIRDLAWVYKKDGTPLLDGLSLLVQYTNASKLVYWFSSNRVLLVDGVNNGHFVGIDKDGLITYGYLGEMPPRNKPKVSYDIETSEFVDTDIDNADIGMGIERGVAVTYAYTIINKYGEESNPSQKFTQRRQMYYKQDTSAIGFEQYWRSLIVTDLKIPDNYPTNKIKDIKYFGLYRQVVYGSEDFRVPEQFTRVALIPVSEEEFDASNNSKQWTDYNLSVS